MLPFLLCLVTRCWQKRARHWASPTSQWRTWPPAYRSCHRAVLCISSCGSGSGSTISSDSGNRYGSGVKVLMTKNWGKRTIEFFKIFGSKIAFYFSLGLHKGRPSVQPSEENIRIHWIRIRNQHFRWIRNPIWIRIQGFNDQKLGEKKQLKIFFPFWIKNCNLLILRPS